MGYNEHVLWIQAENIEIIYILYCVSTSALNFQDLLYIFNIMYMVDYVASTLKLVKWKPCIFAITGFTNIQRFLKHISLFPCVILLQIYLISYPHLYHCSLILHLSEIYMILIIFILAHMVNKNSSIFSSSNSFLRCDDFCKQKYWDLYFKVLYLIFWPWQISHYIKQRKSILRSNTCTLIFQSHILWYLPTRFATIKMEDILTVAQKK